MEESQSQQPPVTPPTKPSKKGKARHIVALIVTIAIAGAVGLGLYWYVDTNHRPVTERQTMQNDGNLQSTGEEEAISNVVEKVSPSVVSIVTNVETRTAFGVADSDAAGTGIIVSANGYILTNHHVIDSATKIKVVTTDGDIYDNVELVGSDPLNDVAYLKVKGVDNLRPAELGDSSTLRVGQRVIAIGNALGQFQNTVSSGIISGKGRPISAGNEGSGGADSLTDLLQTDAAINPGNSGGPLLNYSGQVIGMNTAVASNAEGIGFAIPINATKGTLKSVVKGEGVKRAYLGVRYTDITAAVAKEHDLPVKKGAYISGTGTDAAVVSGGPADKAGLKDKDIITKVNGESVGSDGGVSTLVGEYAPGETIELTYLRDGKEYKTKVTLQLHPSSS
ncbi:MAG: trypsin-like peptidase domain-containing protein [Candidatus Saccharimonas sp.]